MSLPRPEPTPPPDLRLRAFGARLWNALVQWDGATWRSLRRLVTAPGRSAADVFDGAGEPQVHPIRLYLAINVVFFFLAPWVNYSGPDAVINVWYMEHEGVVQAIPALQATLDSAVERSGLEPSLFRLILDDRMKANQGAWVWLLIPILALASFMGSRKRRPFLVEHLVLATQLLSFFLVSLLAVSSVGRLALAMGPSKPFWIATTAVVILVWVIGFPCVVYKSLRSFLEIGRIRGVLLTFWTGLALIGGTLFYLAVLFLVSIHGLRNLQLPS